MRILFASVNSKCSKLILIAHASFGPRFPITQAKKYLRAGPRKFIYFKPEEVRACIVTCGGLCPGLNVVIREIFNCLYYNYKVKVIYGIKFGYKGFYTYDWEELNPMKVKHIHNLGGTILGSSRGGFDADKIIDKLIEYKVNQVESFPICISIF
jgi:6-phosphofructokinase